MKKKSMKNIFSSAICVMLSVIMMFGVCGCAKKDNGKETEKETEKETFVTTDAQLQRVSVHDPSIVVGKDAEGKKCYYIFGSHLAFAKSYDLMSWKTFKNNINKDFRTLFADAFAWSDNGDADYDPSGNMWAPDVIWNEKMGKWCMYMSINGVSWNSSIVLLTADSLEGDWTFVGPVVYSGFNESGTYTYTQTDYVKATGDTDFSVGKTRYVTGGRSWAGSEKSTWSAKVGAHAIDPCVVYDKDGNLYMSYGSWSGGIYLLELDENTGLRDYSVKYENDTSFYTDAYMGIRIAGGGGETGEASYIVWDEEAGYYYLYVTYGGLTASGGYHIREFRSEKIDGPYVDTDETVANKSGARGNVGVKLFGNYYFSSLEKGISSKGYKSGGHNSAFIDEDGSRYLVYHTRFNKGNETHQVRVHQQFLNEDGWLVTAVYEYMGSQIKESGYTKEGIVGDYEIVRHGLSAATSKVGMLKTENITLHEDGTITGDYEGTWEQKEVDGKGYYATIVLKDIEYKGVFFKQFDESEDHCETMTFTAISENGAAIWASKLNVVPTDGSATSTESETK